MQNWQTGNLFRPELKGRAPSLSSWIPCATSDYGREKKAQPAKGDTVAVAEGDETVAYVVAKEHYESLIETIELMSNPAAMAALRRDKSGKSRFRPLNTLDENES